MSNSTVVASSNYGVTQYQPLPTPAGSNGGIYSAGVVTGQNSASSQNALINATKGGKRRFKGGDGKIAVPTVPVAYNDHGKTQGLVANMTTVSATQHANSQYDNQVQVTKTGGRSRGSKRSRNGKRSCRRKGSRKRNKSKRRISRRHR